MSLLRLAFWLALIVLLLPTDAQQQARFSSFATAAMQRVGGFCDRNARTCGVGEQAWDTFLKKAEFGVRLVGDLLGTGGGQQPDFRPTDKRIGKIDPRMMDPRLNQRGTLSPSDLYQPPWRPPPRSRRY
jgi:hypothetical protein